MRRKIGLAILLFAAVLIVYFTSNFQTQEQEPLLKPSVTPVYGDSILEEMKYIQKLADEKLAEQKRQEELKKQQEQAEKEKEQTQSQGKYLGNFRISHYCSCRKCNGGYLSTASGNPLTVGTTIAVDRNVIPLGTTVYIDGYGYRVAHDTGSAIKGNRIDVLVNDHAEAYKLGIVYKDVYLK